MAFLFKSKKNLEKGPAQTKEGPNGVAGSQSSLQGANGRPSREEKGANATPGSSVNNSMNSLGGGTSTPSPDQNVGRRGPSVDQASDLPVSVNTTTNQSLRCTWRHRALRCAIYSFGAIVDMIHSYET
jgi:hypothetical protein